MALAGVTPTHKSQSSRTHLAIGQQCVPLTAATWPILVKRIVATMVSVHPNARAGAAAGSQVQGLGASTQLLRKSLPSRRTRLRVTSASEHLDPGSQINLLLCFWPFCLYGFNVFL